MDTLKKSHLAFMGGEKIRKKPFPRWPFYDTSDFIKLAEYLKDNKLTRGIDFPSFWSGRNPNNLSEKFESILSSEIGCKYVFGVNSGTTALELAIDSLNLNHGDEVIVTPYSYYASASAIKKNGLKPVFADISKYTLNIDVENIRGTLSDRTKAIVVVHFGGIPVDMNEIYNITKGTEIKIIEDCCHTITAKYEGKRTGSLGDIGCFSFQGTKLLSAGEGGALTTNKSDYAYRMFSMNNGGRTSNNGMVSKYKHTMLGGNFRISEIQSALLLLGWEEIYNQKEKRKINVQYFKECLNQIDGLQIIDVDSPDIERDYYIIAVRYTSEKFKGLSRNKFVAALNVEGIPCSTGYSCGLYEYDVLFDNDADSKKYKEICVQTERACSEILWFEHRLFIGDKDDVQDIINGIRKVKENAEQLVQKK